MPVGAVGLWGLWPAVQVGISANEILVLFQPLEMSRLRQGHGNSEVIRTWRGIKERVQAGSIHAAESNAAMMGCDASLNLVDVTLRPDLIHCGATFRSSFGRFIVNAAISRC